jgi:hypothetical protein
MGAYTELVDFTFTANETSRTFSCLSITEDDFIKIVFTHVDASASGSTIGCFPNTTAGVSGFDTTTNYHAQRIDGNGSSVSATRPNQSFFSFSPSGGKNLSVGYLKLSENGKVNIFSNQTRTLDSSIFVRFFYTTSSNLTFNDPITSLTFSSDVTDGLGDGSRIQIYRLDAEKVADITVASDTTQVDISSLSIGKDSEYLLVSDIANPLGSNVSYNLTPNDLTTASDYYYQRIRGNGSTADAERGNLPFMIGASDSDSSLVYSHIKLSEIGAFTAQNYGIRDEGTSSLRLENIFISSTSEAITSITKLNIKAETTDGIGTDSRFILYKLK